MTTMEFSPIAGLHGRLFESPVWDDRRGVLFLCDIEGGLVHEVSLDDGPLRQWKMEDRVASLGLCESGRLVIALARKVILFDPDTGAREDLWSDYDGPETTRFNDGKVGADGAFWVGTMDERPVREPIGRLYRITPGGATPMIDGGIKVSNGLAWAPDGRVMYHSDSQGPWIERHDFDHATGALANRTRIAEVADADGRPDGGACDADGNYWSAGVSAGVVNRYAPDGKRTDSWPVPAPAPTMPCFCGPGLTRLALTSLAPAGGPPDAGGVFIAAAPIAGASVSRMRGA